MKFENWSESYKKWKRDLWKEMEDFYKEILSHRFSHSSAWNRLYAWNKVVWQPCGFCHEFGGCVNCPLYKEHCHSHLEKCEKWKNTMGCLYLAWESSNEAEFRHLQHKFLLVISSFEPRKAKKVIISGGKTMIKTFIFIMFLTLGCINFTQKEEMVMNDNEIVLLSGSLESMSQIPWDGTEFLQVKVYTNSQETYNNFCSNKTRIVVREGANTIIIKPESVECNIVEGTIILSFYYQM